jgi:hypothetical protein
MRIKKEKMSENKILNKVRALLGMEVSLEQMKLTDGVSVLEADAFEAGNEVFIVTEDDQRIALPIGEYDLENGMVLVVAEEGMIAEVKEKEVEEEEAPEVEVEVEGGNKIEEEMAAEAAPKKTVESIIKETFFTKMEELAAENEKLKTELAELKAQTPEAVAEEAAPVELAAEEVEPKPIQHNPENAQPVELFKLTPKKTRSTIDSIFEKLNK